MERELKENELIVSPCGKFGYQFIPLTDIQIVVTREELEAIDKGTKCFDLERNCVVDYDNTKNELIEKHKNEITLLKNLLSQSDYICLKWCEGQISDIEYEYTKNKRREYRLKINQLEQEIEQLKKAS